MKLILLVTGFFLVNIVSAQTIQLLDSNRSISIRGLSVVSNEIIWLSGSKGTVAVSTNGGKTFEWKKVAGFEQRDFRDIEAFNATTAVIIAVDTPAVILKTTDGGNTWKKVFEDKSPGMFLDALEFWNQNSGIVIGDPVEGKIFIARTFDGGETWRGLPEANYPTADEGEAMFASSGTNIVKLNQQE
ncbi:MAG TPA: oxidoreductase, partial [Lacibacter sp.]|nr:oxidoreductase [Lacibacter sp.]